MKVCSVVFNTISRDARVLKEAASLRAAGYDVTVIGLTDIVVKAVSETLDNGVKLVRVDPIAIIDKIEAKIKRVLVLLGIILGVVAVTIAVTQTQDIAFTLPMVVTQIYESPLGMLFLVVTVGMLIVGATKLRQLRQAFRRFLAGKSIYFIKMLGLYLEARRVAPDVIHSHDAITLPIGVALKVTTRGLLIYDAHEIYEEVAQSSPRRAKIYRTIHRLCQRRVDGFITINRSIAQWYAEHYRQLPPAVVVKNATNMAGPIDYDGRLHEAAGLPPERKILLYQGGFSKKRGLEYLVAAARHLSDDWTLVMMGWGTLEDELRGVSEQINNERGAQGCLHAIVFIPPAPHQELALWTAGGTVGIIPYENIGLNHWFCTPNKLWEYPNAALPVLVSPFPELSAPVLEYGFGWLLPEDQEPQALGQLIMSLGSEQIAEARANCGVFMQADNWQFYAEKLVDLYRSLEPRIARSSR